MSYILIILMFSNGKIATTTAEFFSADNCRMAAESVEATSKRFSYSVDATCHGK